MCSETGKLDAWSLPQRTWAACGTSATYGEVCSMVANGSLADLELVMSVFFNMLTFESCAKRPKEILP